MRTKQDLCRRGTASMQYRDMVISGDCLCGKDREDCRCLRMRGGQWLVVRLYNDTRRLRLLCHEQKDFSSLRFEKGEDGERSGRMTGLYRTWSEWKRGNE
jgi:hypothetical protein